MRGNRGALALARQLGPFTVVSVGLGIAEVAAELSS
jgi:hypothetical protein